MLTLLSEGWRIFKRNVRVKLSGFEKFSGTDEEICRKIIDDCWNGRYFQMTPKGGNYACFYSRDFGMCCESLINLGHKDKVINTLEYAIEKFMINNRITVAINPSGIPFNFADIYSPDSVAYFFRSLRITKAKSLIIKYLDFLNSEIRKFEEIVIDKEKGIVRGEHFSGMRDHVIVKRSCYDMIMTCVLSDEIDKINKLLGKNALKNTLKKYPLKKNLVKYYWTGYFKNSPTDDVITGHCNVFPFWLDVFNDKKMLKESLARIRQGKLDEPIPLKYELNTNQKFIWQEFFVKGWERDTVFGHLTMPYIRVLSMIDKKKAVEHINTYRGLIEKHGFVEVYDGLKPYQSLFYASETRMLWAAMYLDLKRRLRK